MKKTADTISPTDVLAMYRMARMDDAAERNDARVLLEAGVEDPITKMRMKKWRTLGHILKNTGKAAGIGALALGVPGAITGGLTEGASGAVVGGMAGATGGATVGAGAYLLAACISGLAGAISGSVSKTDIGKVKDFYNGDTKPSPYNSAFASSQLGKAVQERQARYQMEAPYQVIN